MVAELTGRSKEIQIHHHLASKSGQKHPGAKYVLPLLDQFGVRGADGVHDVLVFPVVGPHLGGMLMFGQGAGSRPYGISITPIVNYNN